MQLKNIVVPVNQLEQCATFFQKFLEHQVVFRSEEKWILTGGLVLHHKKSLEEFVQLSSLKGQVILYYETDFWERSLEKFHRASNERIVCQKEIIRDDGTKSMVISLTGEDFFVEIGEKRESAVGRLLKEGYSSQEVAKKTGISPDIVQYYL